MLTIVLGLMIYAVIGFTIYAVAVWIFILPAFLESLKQARSTGEEDKLSTFLLAPAILPLAIFLPMLKRIMESVFLLALLVGIALVVPIWLILELFFFILDGWFLSGYKAYRASGAFISMIRSVSSPPGKIANKTDQRSNIRR